MKHYYLSEAGITILHELTGIQEAVLLSATAVIHLRDERRYRPYRNGKISAFCWTWKEEVHLFLLQPCLLILGENYENVVCVAQDCITWALYTSTTSRVVSEVWKLSNSFVTHCCLTERKQNMSWVYVIYC